MFEIEQILGGGKPDRRRTVVSDENKKQDSYRHSCHQGRSEHRTVSFTSFLYLCGLNRAEKNLWSSITATIMWTSISDHTQIFYKETQLTHWQTTWPAGCYLVWQCLRGWVANWTAICDTGDFSSHFQNMSQGQIGYISIIRPARTKEKESKG